MRRLDFSYPISHFPSLPSPLMPKLPIQKHIAPLNPVAHAMFDNEPTSQETELVVLDSTQSYSPKIITHSAHPESPYVIRFEMEVDGQADAPVEITNFLTAVEMTHTSTQAEQGLEDLTVGSREALQQASNEFLRFPSVDRKPRTRSLHPVHDMISVDDFIDQIEVNTVEGPRAEELDDEPLLTFDDLIDDIGINEELSDLPSPRTAAHKIEMPVRQKRVKKTRAPRARSRRTLQVGWSKTLAVFVGLSFAVVLPIHAVTTLNDVGQSQGTIIESGLNALGSLEDAATAVASQDFGAATSGFDRAATSFEEAQEELTSANRQLLGIAELVPSQAKDARLLLKAGEATSRAAATLSTGMATVANRTSQSPAAAVSLFDVFAEEALPDLHIAQAAIDGIKIASIPVEHRQLLRDIEEIVASSTSSLEAFHESSDAIQALLGHKQRQRYLVLFQNNTELRPTGGFWGSLAEIDILDGELQSISIPGGGTYDQQGQLMKQVASPLPLQLLRARWELQDANWFPDFPTSAQKAMWFYEQGGGPSVDGVIAINATLVADLINATGSISLPDYGMTIDGENFMFEAQKQVELDYSDVSKPKAFIGDLAPELLKNLLEAEGESFMDVAQLMSKGLADRDIQIYHTDPEIQTAISKLGWDGSVLGNTGDYLMVTHANIGGGKTDGVIDDNITIESSLRNDGRIENLVTIERTHHGLVSSTFSGANNVSFTRIFVPRGSELLSVTGANPPAPELFESAVGLDLDKDIERIENTRIDESTGTLIADGFGKTSFGNWIQTRPGTSSSLTFRYILPNDILDESRDDFVTKMKTFVGIPETVQHSMLIQAQSGVEYRETHYTFHSGELRPLWSTEDTVSQYHQTENVDGFFGMILERP